MKEQLDRQAVSNESDAWEEIGTDRIRSEWRARSVSLPFFELSGDEFEVFSFLLLREHPGESIYY